jgi:hypothetical protein
MQKECFLILAKDNVGLLNVFHIQLAAYYMTKMSKEISESKLWH